MLVAVVVAGRAGATVCLMVKRGMVERGERAEAPLEGLEGLESPALALVLLSVETRPRWLDRVPHALTRLGGRLTLSPMPAERIGDVESNRVVLGSDGWSLVAHSRLLRTPGGVPVHSSSDGLLAVDLRAMSARRLEWTPRPDSPFPIHYALSPHGTQVAVAETFGTKGVREPGPTTLLLAPTGAGEPRELLVLPPSGLVGGSDDMSLQWSPDGDKVALSYWEPDASGPATVVVEVATGHVLCRATGTRLMGSLSFSDDGTRLLVGDNGLYPHILDVATGGILPVAWLPNEQLDPGPRLRACGFLGDAHLLTTRQRTGTVTVSAVHLESGEETPLLRWAGGRDNAPNYGTFSRNWLPELERALAG